MGPSADREGLGASAGRAPALLEVQQAATTHSGPGRPLRGVAIGSDAFYLILGGRAKVLDKPHARVLGVGDYFGEMGLIDGEPRSATVVAVGHFQAMKLPRRPFLKLLRQEPGISIAMLAELASRVRKLERGASA